VTFQRKLLLGFSLMILPVLLVGAEALRRNRLERQALETLGQSMSRTRTYAQLETAMFDQGVAIWRYLSGMDPQARKEFELSGQVVNYWLERWQGELHPDEAVLADGVRVIASQINTVGDSIFQLYETGHRQAAYQMAQRDLKGRLEPALTEINHEIYRRARELSVQQAFTRVEQIVEAERRIQLLVIGLALVVSLLASWLIARSLMRPIRELQQAMVVVGAGQLDHPVEVRSKDEIGDLARAFGQMTENLRQSREHTMRLNAELEAKVKLASIGEMAAAVAHGLRNPLASLRASAQLVRQHPESPASREHLQAIVEQVDRLDRRIAHLLSFSRRAPFHPLRENVPQLVEGLVPAFAELLRERQVELSLSLPPDLPEVEIDPMQVEEALVEIISNALDAMPQGGRLSLGARSTGDGSEPPGVAIEITDTGGGIPEEVLPSVCEPFFTTRPEGTGLGLAIAKRFVEQNGGRLEIASRPGAGTTVRVRLPAVGAGRSA
jgi:signal transduction histidine kinase